MKATEAKRPKELEQGNICFIRLLADAELDKAMFQPQGRRSRRSWLRETSEPGATSQSCRCYTGSISSVSAPTMPVPGKNRNT